MHMGKNRKPMKMRPAFGKAVIRPSFSVHKCDELAGCVGHPGKVGTNRENRSSPQGFVFLIRFISGKQP